MEVCVSLGSADADRAAGRLLAAGFAGLVLGEERFDDAGEGRVEEPGLTVGLEWRQAPQDVEIKVYVAECEGPGRLETVREALDGIPCSIRTQIVREEDWAESWKQFWDVQHIGQSIVIRPSWKTYEARPGEVVIELDPKQAFGTGTHATTRLCLAELERLVRPGDRLLDVGTGSGILAIAALRLGAREAIGVDSDPVAVAAARENAELNGVEATSSFEVGSAGALTDRADLVVANILAEILIDLAPDLARLTGRDLLVSGIIARKAAQTREAFEAQGLRWLGQTQEGDWIAQRFVRR